jgi:EAL and modified HD-GYP domain-containing signal transduction protein
MVQKAAMKGAGASMAETNGSADKVFVARQPIFDGEQNLFGYELLYRSSLNNSYDGADGTSATLAVVREAFLVLGTQLTGTNKAFINFNLDLLKKKFPLLTLRPETTVIEILENVAVDSTVVELCRELKGAGYTIALDDFDPANEDARALVDLADIIKVDFRQSGTAERADILKSHSGKKVEFLAEKVETLEEFFEARAIGYLYFQGYFFGEPQIVSAKNIPGSKINYLRMLTEINRPDMDFPSLEGIIRRDTFLTFTLLNYINSAYFALRDSVGSIMQALALLGEREVRRWASLVLMTFMGADKPSQVSMTSLIRGKFCECLAMKTDLAPKASELFMTGMFSMLDVLVGRPLYELLDRINVSKDIRVALTTGKNRHGEVLQLVLAYERGLWNDVDMWAGKLGLDSTGIASDYGKSVQWVEQVLDLGMAQVKPG